MNKLLTKLLRMFGNPTVPDPKLMLEELDLSLRGYTGHELDQSMRYILPKCSGFFPDPSVIIEACVRARSENSSGRQVQTFVEDSEWTPEAKAKAYDLIKTDLGKKAADEGWIGHLWDFCRKHRRHPTPHEQMKLMSSARSFDELIEHHKKIDGSWAKIGDTFANGALNRRRKLSDIAYGRAS